MTATGCSVLSHLDPVEWDQVPDWASDTWRKSLDDLGDASERSGLVHRYHVTRLEMPPLLGLKGGQSNVGRLSGPELLRELHPDPCDVQIVLPVCGAVADTPFTGSRNGSGRVVWSRSRAVRLVGTLSGGEPSCWDAVVFPEIVALADVLLDPAAEELAWTDSGRAGLPRPLPGESQFGRHLGEQVGRPWLGPLDHGSWVGEISRTSSGRCWSRCCRRAGRRDDRRSGFGGS